MSEDSKKIDLALLIDDDELVNTLNTIIIRQSGVVDNIRTVKSGDKGLQELAQCQVENKWPAIILVDVNMPGMDGWEFLSQFEKKFKSLKRKCVVGLLSSSLDPRDEERANKSAVVDFFISKPLSLEVVKNICQRYTKLDE